jgi:NitT/TauT family transport system ATP-binding protein
VTAAAAGVRDVVAGPALRLSGVGKVYADGTPALADVDLRVGAGEIVSVVGPSGCGKSTLLRLVAGLADASAGDVAVQRDRLGFVFQDPTLLPWRTVRGNVELAGRLSGLDRRAARTRADEALALTGLDGFAGHLPRRLSGGMRMRVALARELATSPELFLLDEPFGALDELTRQRLDDELLRLHAERGFAALFVTHNVAEAVYLSDRVLVLSARPGRVVADVRVDLGRPRDRELRFDPAFVALTHEVTARLGERP